MSGPTDPAAAMLATLRQRAASEPRWSIEVDHRDVPALVAEVERLSAALAVERDHADLLAFVMDKAYETRREVVAEHRARRAAEAKESTS